jgi:tetratricopeptide (TPR) repeat protein
LQRINVKISSEVQALLGQAHRYLIAKEYAEAIPIYHDIIRLNASLLQPYHQLMLIYEEACEDEEKARSLNCTVDQAKEFAVEMCHIAAETGAKDVELWKKAAEMSHELIGDLDKSLYCLNRVIRLDPTDYHSLWNRSYIYREKGMYKKASEGYEFLLKEHPENKEAIQLEMARTLYLQKKSKDATKLLEELVQCSSPNLNSINMLAELYVVDGQFEKALPLLESVMRSVPREEVPLQILVQLAICRLQSEARMTPFIQSTVDQLLAADLETNREMHEDLGSALAGKGFYELALQLLRRATTDMSSEKICNTWLKIAQCLNGLGQFEEARIMSQNAIGFKTQLSSQLHVPLWKRDPSVATSLLEEGIPHFQTGRFDHYISTAHPILLSELQRHDKSATDEDGSETRKKRGRKSKAERERADVTYDIRDHLGTGQFYSHVFRTALALFLCHRTPEALELLQTSRTSSGPTHLRLLRAAVFLAEGNYSEALLCLKSVASKFADSPEFWILVNTYAGAVHYPVYMYKSMFRVTRGVRSSSIPETNSNTNAEVYLDCHRFYSANHHLATTYYGMAAQQFLSLSLSYPGHTLPLLGLAVSFLLAAQSSKKTDRIHLAATGLSYMMEYVKVEPLSYVAHYNTGRAYLALEQRHLALDHFERVLQTGDTLYQRLAAHQMTVIYAAAGNYLQAGRICRQIVI